jgi:predicted RNA binding protein YcfA (HicA-like mRNA interferase family)
VAKPGNAVDLESTGFGLAGSNPSTPILVYSTRATALKYRDFVRILEAHGFSKTRQSGSHKRYEGLVDGKVQLVTVSGEPGDDILPRNFASMIRQSALPKKLFKG